MSDSRSSLRLYSTYSKSVKGSSLTEAKMSVNRCVSCSPSQIEFRSLPYVLAGLLVSVSLAQPEVNNIDLTPLRALIPYREILRLNIPVDMAVTVHVLNASKL
jgi:hypothetical protein